MAVVSVSPSSPKLELYIAHRAALVDYAAPIVGCRAQAEDVVQEAWLRFNGRDHAGEPINQPVGYLYRIVRNLALDLKRRVTTERRQPDGGTLLAEIADQSPGPEYDQRATLDRVDSIGHVYAGSSAAPGGWLAS